MERSLHSTWDNKPNTLCASDRQKNISSQAGRWAGFMWSRAQLVPSCHCSSPMPRPSTDTSRWQFGFCTIIPQMAQGGALEAPFPLQIWSTVVYNLSWKYDYIGGGCQYFDMASKHENGNAEVCLLQPVPPGMVLTTDYLILVIILHLFS